MKLAAAGFMSVALLASNAAAAQDTDRKNLVNDKFKECVLSGKSWNDCYASVPGRNPGRTMSQNYFAELFDEEDTLTGGVWMRSVPEHFLYGARKPYIYWDYRGES